VTDIAQSWISTEAQFSRREEYVAKSKLTNETQQDDQPELQITLQEVIDMIDITAPKETMADDGRPEETMADEDLQWFD